MLSHMVLNVTLTGNLVLKLFQIGLKKDRVPVVVYSNMCLNMECHVQIDI
jgi:hypothetical protein